MSVKLDVVTFEVLRHRLWEINDEMGIIAARISGSPAVYESGDFNTALLTASGKGLFTGVYIIRQAAALDVVVQSVIKQYGDDIRNGDMFLLNDPWCGALHAMDYAVVAPVFWEDELIAWTGIVMHETDVGGPVPGSWTVGAKNAYEECPLMPPVKIVDAGKFKKEIEALYLRNTRVPDINALNLRAKIAAQLTTRDRLHDIIRQYGRDTFVAVQERILEYVRTSVRKRLAKLPDGTWYGRAIVDHDGNENRLYRIKLALTKRGDELILDFTGTSAQAAGPINCAYSGLVGGVTQVLFPLLCFDIPWSHGAITDCIKIISEEGTINNCTFPAATSMATVNSATATGNAVWEAMSRLYSCSEELQDEVVAMGYGGMNLGLLSGFREDGKYFINMFTDSVGGGGGTRRRDGVNTCGSMFAPSYGIPNVERIEGLLPVLYVYRKERSETAGAGMKRGGVGIEYLIVPYGTEKNIEAVYFATGCNHMIAKGLNGGLPGSVQENLLLRDAGVKQMLQAGIIPTAWGDVERKDTNLQEAKSRASIRPTDAWVNFCCGGGGYGDPVLRDPADAALDLENGVCTSEEINRLYGVVVDRDGNVDHEATRMRRAELIAARKKNGVRLDSDWRPGAKLVGNKIFRYGEALAVEKVDSTAVIGCVHCNFVLGPACEDPRQRSLMIESPITEFSPLNSYGRVNDVVVRQYCCPGCAAMFSSDVQLREDDPQTPEMHLLFEAQQSQTSQQQS